MEVVKLEHIPGFDNEEIKVVDDYKMDVPKELPQGFFSLLSVGASGSGKTNATLNLIKKLKPYYNRYILISPTGCYDEERQQRAEKKYDKLKIDFDEEHSCYHRGLIGQILQRQREKLIEYETWKRYKDVYARFIRFMKANKKLAQLEPVMWGFPDLDILLAHDFADPKDPYYFPTQIAPTAMLIIDDMASTPIYNTHSLGELTNLQMKNRHYKMSVLNLVQAYKLCPRSIRLNSRVMMLFPCKSEKMIKEFADTCNNQYNPEQFLKMFEYATRDKPYDFLYIDNAEPKGFRKNFNERLDVIGGEAKPVTLKKNVTNSIDDVETGELLQGQAGSHRVLQKQ
jgi:hypothetical protein